MQGLEALKAAVPGFVRRKGRSGGRISALEAVYEEYQLTDIPYPPGLTVSQSCYFNSRGGGTDTSYW